MMKIQVFLKLSVRKNFANFSRKHQRWEVTCDFIKKRLQYKYFPVKFLRTPSLRNHSGGCYLR